MRQQHTLVYIISFFIATYMVSAQDITQTVQQEGLDVQSDTTQAGTPNNKYGLRIGVDLSKPLRTVLDDKYSGFEIVGDFRIKKNYYLAAEIGNEKRNLEENTFNATAKGSYIKAGFNYNAYENWAGMSNLIYAGLRVGFSTFSQEISDYTIYTTTQYFGSDLRENPVEYTGLNATWLEFQVGVQAELFNNLYLGLNLQLKRLITQKKGGSLDNLYIPGFNKVTTDNNFGAGYGYTLTYLIPIFRK